MGHKAILNELKNTPEDQLQELTTLTEDEVMQTLGNAEALAPDTEEPEFVIVNDDDTDPDQEEEDQDNEEEDQERETETDDEESGTDNIDPDEPTEIEIDDNFFTAEEAVGLLDNGVAELESLIFKYADVNVKQSDLHYSAKQKKLLQTPLEKAFKKTKFKVKSPWAAFAMVFVGLEVSKVTKILGQAQIEKKHKEEISQRDAENANLKWQIYQMQQQMMQMQQNQQNQQQFYQGNNTPHSQEPARSDATIRDNKGRFAPGTGQAKRKKGELTRKPGETRGRKPKGQTIPFNQAANQ